MICPVGSLHTKVMLEEYDIFVTCVYILALVYSRLEDVRVVDSELSKW